MRVGEDPLSWCGNIHKREVRILGHAMRDKALSVVAGVVMYRLKHGSIWAHIPFRSTEGVLAANLPPPFVSRFVACPPKHLQIYQRVDDRVVPVLAPGWYQLRSRVEELFQPVSSAKRTGTKGVITSQVKSHRRGVVIQKSCVMILQRLLTAQLRPPEFRPFAILFLMGRRIELPELSRPKTSCPEISVLLLPLAGLIVCFREKSRPGMRGNWFGRRLENGLPLQSGAIDGLPQQSEGLLDRSRFVGDQSIGRRLLAAHRARHDANVRWLRHTFGLFLHRVQEFFPTLDCIGRKNQGLTQSFLFLISVADPVIGSFLIPSRNRVPGLRAIAELESDKVVLGVVPECGVRRQRDRGETQLLSRNRFCCRCPLRNHLFSPSRQPLRR